MIASTFALNSSVTSSWGHPTLCMTDPQQVSSRTVKSTPILSRMLMVALAVSLDL